MESIASYLIPRPILDKLASTNGVRSGLASGFGWVLHGDLLEFWRYSDGRTAEVRSLRLPNALTAYDSNANATLFVSILSQGKARAVSVLICSSKGVLAAWMDANLFNVDPTIHSLIPYETSTESSPPIITSFSAIVPSEASGHQAVFLASAGLSDGSWALLQGSTSQGILSKRINQKALTHSTPITSSSSSLPPLLTKLTSAVAWGLQEAFDPSARILKKTPGSGGVASIQILSVDTTKVRVLILYDASLDCWQVNLGLRPSELLLWSFCNLNLAQTLTTTNTSSSNPRRPGPESRNALLSNLPLTSFLDSTSRCVYVWMLDSGEGSPRHYLQKIILDCSSPSSSSSSSSLAPIHDWCVHVEPMDACGSRASSPMHLSCQVGVGDGGSCLMMAGPGHVLVECWVPDSSRSTLRSSGEKGGKGGGGEGEVKGLPSSRLLSSDPDNLALAPFINPNPSPPSQGHQGQGPLQAAYLVLSTTYGVIELPPPSTTSTSIMGHGSGPLTHDQIQQIFQLLDTTCHQALLLRQQHQQRGQDLHQPSAPDPNSNSNLNLNLRGWPPLRALVSGLTRRLQSLSAFSPSTNLEVLLKYSSHLCDQTPTEWAQASLVNLTAGSNNNNSGGFGGGGGGVSFIEQLRDKGSRHESFLAIMAESGILRGLEPLLQISLVENQEKLAAAHDLLTLQSTLSSHLASQGGPPSGLQLLADNLELMEGLTARSGLLSFSGPNDTPGQGEGQRVKGLERFYSQPTLSTPHLFQSISESSQVISRQFESDPGSKESLLMRSRLSFLSKTLGTVVAASNKVRSMAQKQYRMDLGHLYLSLGRPGWWQGPEPRSKIETLLEHIQAAIASSPSHAATAATAGGMQSDPAPLLFDPSPSLYESHDLRDLSRSMFGVTEVLFSAHAATVASAHLSLSLSLSLSLDASNTLSSLKPKSSCLSEYREARVKHAPPLYSQAISELPPLSSYARGGGGGCSSSVVDPDSLIWHLEDLFSSHHCYPELFSTTRYLTLLVRLHQQHASTATRPPSTFHHHPPPLSTSHASSGHPREAQREVYSRMHACMTRMAAEDGAPERETFSNYVFQQLLDLGLHSELLSLPMDKFKSGLVAFLQPHPQLLWLLWLLIDKGSQGGSRAVGGGGLKEATLALSCTSDLARQAKDMRSHYRLECLATLSSYAEQDPHSSRLHSSRLHLVHIQRELSSLAGGVGGNVEGLSTLEDSVDLALSLARKSDRGSQKSDHAVLLALKTLLVCPRGELEGNQERWREVWRQLLLATNWPRLGQEGGSRNVRRPRQDQDQGQGQNEPEPEPEGEGEGVVRVGELGPALMDTPLYLGALSCGGREAMGFMGDGTFNPKRVAEVRGWINEWCLDLAASGELGLDRSGHLETTPSQIKGKGKEVDAVAVGATATGRVTRSSRKVQQSPQALLLTPAGRGKRVAGEVALDPVEERRAIMELPIAAFELALAQIS